MIRIINGILENFGPDLSRMSKRQVLESQLRWEESQQHCEPGSKNWRLCDKRIRQAARNLSGRF